MAGYSGTPLAKKLGISVSTLTLLLNAPREYAGWLDLYPPMAGKNEVPDLIHLFAANHRQLDWKKILPFVKKNPKLVIWISWYKKSSGRATDLTEDIIRQEAIDRGLVDVKVCAVSEDWSGLKLVVPLALR